MAPSFVHSLARAYHEVTAAFEREVGMTQARIVLLAQLRATPEVSQAVLQERLAIDGAAITRQVKQMESAGLVTRRSDPSDHRFTLVSLTAQGRKVADSVVRRRDGFEARITAGLATKDVVRALERVRQAVRPAR
ncbi:MAG TPA: MarR family winged helix-turn-helix transcriptional regulator [Polyangiaceae bacterium]|nr:MarR family winged helix-turn-helix transcriptional regulator [Polyangiaceae bacterium]